MVEQQVDVDGLDPFLSKIYDKFEGFTKEEIIQHPEVIERISQEIDTYNSGFGKWEQVKKFELIKDEFSVDNDELTPTLKLKRKVIKEHYKHLIEKIYRPVKS